MKKFVIVFSAYAGILLGAAGVNEVWEHRPAGPAPAVTGRLVFARAHDIWTMAADASSSVQFTDEVGVNFADNPRFSPDGATIVFIQHQGSEGRSRTTPGAGGGHHRATGVVDSTHDQNRAGQGLYAVCDVHNSLSRRGDERIDLAVTNVARHLFNGRPAHV